MGKASYPENGVSLEEVSVVCPPGTFCACPASSSSKQKQSAVVEARIFVMYYSPSGGI
jgi:hypothetical protein